MSTFGVTPGGRAIAKTWLWQSKIFGRGFSHLETIRLFPQEKFPPQASDKKKMSFQFFSRNSVALICPCATHNAICTQDFVLCGPHIISIFLSQQRCIDLSMRNTQRNMHARFCVVRPATNPFFPDDQNFNLLIKIIKKKHKRILKNLKH